MKKIWIFGILVAITFIFTFAFNYFGKSLNPLQSNVILNTSVGNQSGTNQNEISEADLSAHNTEPDCWIAYNGKVYDITAWLQKHPGGVNAILPYCGTSKAFQDAFTKKHGTTKVAILMQVGQFMGDLKYQGPIAYIT